MRAVDVVQARVDACNRPILHAQVVDRILLGNKVIDHERNSGVRDAPFGVVVAYEVNGTTIDRVWMLAPE